MRRCLLSILLWTITTSAQSPAGVPLCAKPAVDSGIRGSGCAVNDVPCICSSENLVFALESANDFCDAADQGKLYALVESLCNFGVLGARDVSEDDGDDDTPSPAIASEGTDQATFGMPVFADTPTFASEGTDQATIGTSIASPTPVVASEGLDQAILGTPIPAPVTTPTIVSEGPNQVTLSAPTVIAAAQTPLPTGATSIVTDTREFSPPEHSSNSVVTTQQTDAAGDDSSGLTSATITSPDPESIASPSDSVTRSSSGDLLGQSPSSVTEEAGNEVSASVSALVVAVVGLTWVFAKS